MKIQISFDKSWIRADFVRKDGKRGRNLYHTDRKPYGSLLEQLKCACEYVRYYGPDSKDEIEFVAESPAYANLIAAATK
jgi:hypothetical protein